LYRTWDGTWKLEAWHGQLQIGIGEFYHRLEGWRGQWPYAQNLQAAV
jgi:hypothetical protein